MRLGRFILLLLASLLTTVGTPRFAMADASQNQSFTRWHQMDACAKQAAKQFPDHTPEGNAKREAARQQCLRINRLPVTEPVPTQAPY